jgi:ER lumen protein retaining receptor
MHFCLNPTSCMSDALLHRFPKTYNKGIDYFGGIHIPTELGLLYIVVPAAVLALLLHPSLNGNWYTDVAWTLALYVEAVAILPQLLMFQKARDKEIELFTANFVFFTAVARALHFFFWLSSYHELNDKYATHWGSKYPGQLVLLSQIVNLLVMVRF